MFSGSFGVRSIVLCKCSGKYIDIYFKLKIKFYNQIASKYGATSPQSEDPEETHCARPNADVCL